MIVVGCLSVWMMCERSCEGRAGGRRSGMGVILLQSLDCLVSFLRMPLGDHQIGRTSRVRPGSLAAGGMRALKNIWTGRSQAMFRAPRRHFEAPPRLPISTA